MKPEDRVPFDDPPLPIEAFAHAAKMVRAFGCTAAQAAAVLAEFGKAARLLDAEGKALRAKPQWYRRWRW